MSQDRAVPDEVAPLGSLLTGPAPHVLSWAVSEVGGSRDLRHEGLVVA